MAEIWGLALGSVVAGGVAYAGSRQAAKAAQRGADAATAESSRQFDLVRDDTAGLRSIQTSALDDLARLYGWTPASGAAAAERAAAPMLVGDTELPPGATTKSVGDGWYEVWFEGQRIGTLRPGGPNGKFINDTGFDVGAAFDRLAQQQKAQAGAGDGRSPDMSAFFESPDYQYNLEQSEKAINRAQASTGRFNSGRAGLELTRNASGMASAEYGNFVNRLLAAAGLGTTGVTTSANAGMTSAGQIGAAQQNAGNARASAYMTGAQGINNAVQGGISNYLLTQYLQRPGGSSGGAGGGVDPYGYYNGGGVRLT